MPSESGHTRIAVGTLGIATIEGKALYLCPEEKKLPVPRYFFRVVGKSHVYVINNNPHGNLATVKREIHDIFGDVTFPEIFKDSVEKGITFKMSFESFKPVSENFPKISSLPK